MLRRRGCSMDRCCSWCRLSAKTRRNNTKNAASPNSSLFKVQHCFEGSAAERHLLDGEQVLDAHAKCAILVVSRLIGYDHARLQRLRDVIPLADGVWPLVHVQRRALPVIIGTLGRRFKLEHKPHALMHAFKLASSHCGRLAIMNLKCSNCHLTLPITTFCRTSNCRL